MIRARERHLISLQRTSKDFYAGESPQRKTQQLIVQSKSLLDFRMSAAYLPCKLLCPSTSLIDLLLEEGQILFHAINPPDVLERVKRQGAIHKKLRPTKHLKETKQSDAFPMTPFLPHVLGHELRQNHVEFAVFVGPRGMLRSKIVGTFRSQRTWL